MEANEHDFADVWSGQCGPIDTMEGAAWEQGERATVQALSEAVDTRLAAMPRPRIQAVQGIRTRLADPVPARPSQPLCVDVCAALLAARELALLPLRNEEAGIIDLRERA